MDMLAILLATLLQSSGDPVDEALALAGLTTETARFDQSLLKLWNFDEFVLGSFEAYYENPWRIPAYQDGVMTNVAKGVASVSEVAMAAGRLNGMIPRRTLLGDPTAALQAAVDKQPDLASALKALDAKGSYPKPTGVPAAVEKAAALIARAVAPVLEARTVSFQGGVGAAYKLLSAPADESPTRIEAELQLARSADPRYMMSAATDLLIACEKARGMLATLEKTRFHFEAETPYGWVVLNGSADDSYSARPYLLILDMGGDDTYLGGARNASAANGVSVTLDLSGNDKYLSKPTHTKAALAQASDRKEGGATPGIGGALCGVAILMDSAGDDLYRTLGPSQGSATYGLAALWDGAGNDVYDCYSQSQGYGASGVGILADGAGSDRYDCFVLSQGAAVTRGVGLLADAAGNDRYVANDTVLDEPASQTKEHNSSLAQGCAFGRRADYSDGHSLGGGFGILCDLAGDDEYSCGVFGQGVGYWKGVGMLLDKEGADSYRGVWYVQGAAAHFAIGVLRDYTGNDKYVATMNMAQGAGHDFSIGLLEDDAGNDSHEAPNLSLGGGNANGIGIFLDRAGDDSYSSSGVTLGKASAEEGVRQKALTLGLFLDLGGNDTFPASCPWAKNGEGTANYTRKGDRPTESQVGVFLDRK